MSDGMRDSDRHEDAHCRSCCQRYGAEDKLEAQVELTQLRMIERDQARAALAAAHMHGMQQAETIASLEARLRELEAELKTVAGPITDPTQGVVTVGKHFVSTSELDVLELAIARDEEVLEVGDDGMGVVPREFFERCLRARKKTEKPSCVPADCQHFEQLPSGLWAWVEGEMVYIEDSEVPVAPWFIQSHWLTRDDAFLGIPRAKRLVPEEDFLAARALGERVLGWAK